MLPPGRSTARRKTIEDAGAKPSFLGYGGFPGSACVSLNDQVIHGIPSKHAVVKEGDIVKVDVGAYIGGFHGGDQNDPDFRELLVRWFQYGVFCPVFRLHGARVFSSDAQEGMGYGGAPSGAPNEVWSYGEEAYGILCKYLFLRERIRGYVMAQMDLCHQEGIPPMRPLFVDYPEDEAAWSVKDQFLFGPDILVSPITHGGQTSRSVYLPKGARWVQVGTGQVLEGGQAVECAAPLETIPLFVREGGSVEAKTLEI